MAPKLAVGPPTIGWLHAALAAMADIESESFPPRLRVPVLMLAAGDDQVVSSKAIEDFQRGSKPARKSCCAVRATRSCRSAT